MSASAISRETDDRRIKSYGLFGTVQFIEKTYPRDVQARIMNGVPQEVQDFIAAGPKQPWAPPLLSCHLWERMVDEASNDAEAVDTLVRCGVSMGEYATNTYLRLLMKVVTMKILARKFPSIWRKDANFGDLEADASEVKDGKLKIHMKNLGSYPYFGPICQGWNEYALEAMGLKNVKMELQDWSLESPDPGELVFHASWTP